MLLTEDLVDCCFRAAALADRVSSRAYNIGGGPENAISLLELLGLLETSLGRKISPGIAGWRPGDQRVFISDIDRARRDLPWKPTVSKEASVAPLIEWAGENQTQFE